MAPREIGPRSVEAFDRRSRGSAKISLEAPRTGWTYATLHIAGAAIACTNVMAFQPRFSIHVAMLVTSCAAMALPFPRLSTQPRSDSPIVQQVVYQGQSVTAADTVVSSIVRIQVNLTSGSRECTGFLLSPRHVVTVAQCFFPPGQTSPQATPEQVQITWIDPASGTEALTPQRILIHPGYLKNPTYDSGWISSSIRVSEFDIALVTFSEIPKGGVRPFPIDAEGMRVPTDYRVRAYGLNAGVLTRGDFVVEEQNQDENVAVLHVQPESPQKLDAGDLGGPALTIRPDGVDVVWGLLAGQNADWRNTPGAIHLIQLSPHVYWLMNQMLPELQSWLTDRFATRFIQEAKACPPPRKKKTSTLPERVPIPKPRPRYPNSVGAMARGLTPPPQTKSNPLLHPVVVMGEEAPEGSPLLKSIVNISIAGANCSGTLISPIHVLTAAHCFSEEALKNPAQTTASFYRNSRDQVIQVEAVRLRRHRVFIDYPKKEDGNLDTTDRRYLIASATDIALITLKSPVPAPFEPMALLPFDLALERGQTIHVAGTGRDSLTDKASIRKLKSTTMTVGPVLNHGAWTVYPDGHGGVMPGDSGGAAIYYDKTSRPYLWGVIIQTAVDEEKSKLYHSKVLPIFQQSGWIYESVQADLFDILSGALAPKTEKTRAIGECTK